MNSKHISDHDLQLYFLGKATEGVDLASLEGHLLECPLCVNRAHTTEDHLDVLRRVIIVKSYESADRADALQLSGSILATLGGALRPLKLASSLKQLLLGTALFGPSKKNESTTGHA